MTVTMRIAGPGSVTIGDEPREKQRAKKLSHIYQIEWHILQRLFYSWI